MSKKIMKHPDKEEIIRMLNDGESVRKVAAWTKEKYPTNKGLHLSTVTIQKFRKDNLQLEGKVLKDIQEASVVQQRALEEQQREVQLAETNAYQDKINEIADTHLDVASKIMQLDGIIEDRMEYWFNAIKTGEAEPKAADKEMRQYMDRQMALLQQYKKFIEGIADKTVEHNVNVTVMNEQITMLRDVIRDIIEEFNPDLAMVFVEKLNSKLNNLEYLPQVSDGVDAKELKTIEAQVISDEDLDD
jgi:hypothetical protein